MKSFRDLCHWEGEALWSLAIKPGDISPAGAFTGYCGTEKGERGVFNKRGGCFVDFIMESNNFKRKKNKSILINRRLI